MKKFLVSLFALYLLSSFFIKEQYPLKSPPGVIKIQDNFYCDRNEVSNLSWQEYQYWTARTFGVQSLHYKKTVPDTNLFKRLDSCLASHIVSYWKNPIYRNYPVIGISRKQAEDFSKWRSDRVMEFTLIQMKILKWNPENNAENYFTTERYLKGEYQNMQVDKRIQFVPKYSLMNNEEEALILKYNDSLIAIRNFPEEKNYAFNCKRLKLHQMPLHGEKKMPKAYSKHLMDIMGNAAEWKSIDDAPAFPLVGFRNVFRWEKINN